MHAVFIFSFIAISTAAMTGGLTEQDPTKSEFHDIAWKSVKGLNDQASNNGPYYYVPIKVAKAHTQVVAGQKTILEVYVGQSSCKKGEMQAHELTSSNCQLKDGGSRALYKIELWEKPWENFEQFNVEKIRDVGASESI